MKESMFNIYLVDEREKNSIVFNTMSRSVILMDDEVYTLIKNNSIDEIDDNILRSLKKENIIVDDDADELEMLKIRFNRGKYKATSVGITVIPTHACNLACTYCYQGHGDVLSTTMSDETVRRTIEFIKKNAVGYTNLAVNFYGGEPLLFPDILFKIAEEVKSFAEEHGITFMVSATSNGTLFTEDVVEKLNHYNHKVQITLCGPKEVHDQIRVDKKGNGTYDTLMDVINLFRKHNISFHVRVDVDQSNYDAVTTLLDDLNTRGFNDFYIAFCPIGEDVCYSKMELDIKGVDSVSLTRLFKLAHEKGFKTNPITIHNFVEGCSALLDSFLAIDPHGDVYKCIAAPNYKEHKLGTVDENGDLADMSYRAYCTWTLRDPLRIEECVTCKFSPVCGGGCALAAYAKHGSINSPGCEEEELGEVVRTYVMLKFPELFETSSYETIIL
jgi:uncharacterized protein